MIIVLAFIKDSLSEITPKLPSSFFQGCIHQFEEELGSHLVVLGAVGCGISLVQVFGMILSCCLYIKLKDVDDEY